MKISLAARPLSRGRQMAIAFSAEITLCEPPSSEGSK